MKEFRKYQHIERFGNLEVDSIELGVCYIFPKIDGTNASFWVSDGDIKVGSRNRKLSLEKDNGGCYAAVLEDKKLLAFFEKYPQYRLFAEWLIPHSLKTYKENAWRKYYIFDVCLDTEDGLEYIPYENYQPLLEEFELDYIPPLTILKNGSYDSFIKQLENNVFLIEDGKGIGEGIVIKNYDFKNKFGRTTWAKIITSEFKEKHNKVMGAPEMNGALMIEEKIIEKFCTKTLIEKNYAKVTNDNNGWTSKNIPELFNRVFYDLINEEMWNILKEYKNPKVDFRILFRFAGHKIKQVKKELF